MASVVLEQAQTVRDEHGITKVGLSGGVFQNRFLTEHVLAMLAAAGFEVCLPEALPVNDAALISWTFPSLGSRVCTTKLRSPRNSSTTMP